jgi:hypothetical protein
MCMCSGPGGESLSGFEHAHGQPFWHRLTQDPTRRTLFQDYIAGYDTPILLNKGTQEYVCCSMWCPLMKTGLMGFNKGKWRWARVHFEVLGQTRDCICLDSASLGVSVCLCLLNMSAFLACWAVTWRRTCCPSCSPPGPALPLLPSVTSAAARDPSSSRSDRWNVYNIHNVS